MLLDLCHSRSNNFSITVCIVSMRRGGKDNHRERKIRVGQELRKRKEKGGVMSGGTAFCSGGHSGSASKTVNTD